MTQKNNSVKTETTTSEPVEIAIIGGGIAGVYLAWRIALDSSDNIKATLYESENQRLGGRIHSQEIPGLPFKAELGAMRFRLSHQILCALLSELGIPIRKFDVENPVYYIRGRRLTHSELKAGRCKSCGADTPFHLRPCEQDVSPSDLIKRAVDEAIEKLTFVGIGQSEAQRLAEKLSNSNGEIPPETWKKVKEHGRFGDIPLYNIGFWNLLHHFLSNEAFVMLHDLLSLDSILGNWNAAEAIPWFLSDFANNDFYMIPSGTSTIIERLEEQLRASKKVSVQTNAAVNSVERETSGRWRLDFMNGKSKSYDKVVLALPRRALEMITIKNGEQKYPPEWVSSVRPHRMFKLFLVYENAWWVGDTFPGHDDGRVYTDLPLRQVYYFSPTWMRKCYKVAKSKEFEDIPGARYWSLVMASYSDEHYVSFWNPVLSDPTLKKTEPGKKHFHLPSNLPDDVRDEIGKIPQHLLASERMVEKVQRQLAEIHHDRDIPKPLFGVFKDWGADPFAGGWHTWEVGTRPWKRWDGETMSSDGSQKVEDQFLKDYPDLYLCGEAYSSVQGWIESALKSAEEVLRQLSVKNHLWTKGNGISELDNYLDY